MSGQPKAVGNHYNVVQWMYSTFWSTRYLRWGLWDESTRHVRDACQNADNVVARSLNVSASDRVLDAGCGVGQTAVLLAKNYGCQVVGLNLSNSQLCTACKLAADAGVSGQVTFEEQDFTRTRFESGSFTKILAIESIYHVQHQYDFVSEAFRLLNKSGRAAVLDRFLLKRGLSNSQERQLAAFVDGHMAGPLSTVDEFRHYMAQAGFQEIFFEDKLASAWPGISKGTRLLRLTHPFRALLAQMGFLCPVHNMCEAWLAEKSLFDQGILTYGLFVATK